MKTALELLGDVKPIDYDPNRYAGHDAVFRMTPMHCSAWLELVAERAREEMREAAAVALEDAAAVAVADLGPEDVAYCAAQIRALPTHPALTGKERP